MNIPYSFDHTGFPLLHLIDLGCYVHLLPVTKAQFAEYAGQHEYTRSVYEKASHENPLDREAPAHTIDLENHFMTGLLPDEAVHFSTWLEETDELDGAFALPSIRQWREVYRVLKYERCEPLGSRILADCSNAAAREVLRLVFDHREPHTLLDLSLMKDGVVEWVVEKGKWKGLGSPRSSFFPNTFDPLCDEFAPIDVERRMKPFGFRLIRTFG